MIHHFLASTDSCFHAFFSNQGPIKSSLECKRGKGGGRSDCIQLHADFNSSSDFVWESGWCLFQRGFQKKKGGCLLWFTYAASKWKSKMKSDAQVRVFFNTCTHTSSYWSQFALLNLQEICINQPTEPATTHKLQTLWTVVVQLKLQLSEIGEVGLLRTMFL